MEQHLKTMVQYGAMRAVSESKLCDAFVSLLIGFSDQKGSTQPIILSNCRKSILSGI
jgi:hypothetical protein